MVLNAYESVVDLKRHKITNRTLPYFYLQCGWHSPKHRPSSDLPWHGRSRASAPHGRKVTATIAAAKATPADHDSLARHVPCWKVGRLMRWEPYRMWYFLYLWGYLSKENQQNPNRYNLFIWNLRKTSFSPTMNKSIFFYFCCWANAYEWFILVSKFFFIIISI